MIQYHCDIGFSLLETNRQIIRDILTIVEKKIFRLFFNLFHHIIESTILYVYRYLSGLCISISRDVQYAQQRK